MPEEKNQPQVGLNSEPQHKSCRAAKKTDVSHGWVLWTLKLVYCIAKAKMQNKILFLAQNVRTVYENISQK
jgi:hypothetical protein